MWLKRLTALTIMVSSCSLVFATNHYIGTNLKRPRVIVFVHGLWGSHDSWRGSNKAYWPEMLSVDSRFSRSDVFVAEYSTPDHGNTNSTVDLANLLWKQLSEEHLWSDHREVVFVCHSLGGLVVERMLIAHADVSAQVPFLVSFGTPHEGSFLANFAALFGKDPLLTDLKYGEDNDFLMKLDTDWRNSGFQKIRRFCAFEGVDTPLDTNWWKTYRPHIRVVRYYSATYGCDSSTPVAEVMANHMEMVKPADRNSEAYVFLAKVYHDNPIVEPRTVFRDAITPELQVDCERTNSNSDLVMTVPLDVNLREHVSGATASIAEDANIKDVNPNPPSVWRLDENGAAHVKYGFNGNDRSWGNCSGGGHAKIKVHFQITQLVPIPDDQ